MAKRFTDTDKWKMAWFRKLGSQGRDLWYYIHDYCDNAGLLEIDLERFSFDLGFPVTFDMIDRVVNGKLVRVADDRVFLPAFVQFQYGELSPESKPHKSVIKSLQEEGIDPVSFKPLQDSPKEYPKGIHTLKDKDKDKDRDQDKEKPAQKSELAQAPLEALFKTWQATLRHFKIERSLSEQEKLEIARAAQRHGAEIVDLALQGARYEAKSDGFDPSQHVSIQRVLKPDRNGMSKLDKFANLGSANQSANKPERVWDPKTKTYVEVSS